MKRKKFPKVEKTNQSIFKLLVEGPKTFGEIDRYLRENGIEYTKKGLVLRLHELEKEKSIGKKMIAHQVYPVYFIISDELKDQYVIADGGNSFQIDSMDYFFDYPKTKLNSKKLTDSIIKQLSTRIGLYVIYCHLHSWKLTSKKQTLNHNLDLRKKWLNSSLQFPLEYNRYIDFLFDFIEPKTYDSPKVLFRDEKQIKKLFQLEKTLTKLFPKEMSILDSNLSKTSEKSRMSRVLKS